MIDTSESAVRYCFSFETPNQKSYHFEWVPSRRLLSLLEMDKSGSCITARKTKYEDVVPYIPLVTLEYIDATDEHEVHFRAKHKVHSIPAQNQSEGQFMAYGIRRLFMAGEVGNGRR